MNDLKFKHIELSQEEVMALKPLYDSKCCPKKCHIGEKRLWFIPKNLVYMMKNLEYTCCSYCFYNKDNMNLLDGKYTREELVGILSEGLDCNCDESDDLESVSYKLSDGFLLSVYESSNDSKFLELHKINDNKFNIYFNKMYTGNISIVLYKLIKEDNDDDDNKLEEELEEKIIYAKLKEDINNLDDDMPSMSVVKSYLHNNEFCMTLSKLMTAVKGYSKYNKIYCKPLKFNFQKINKQSITLEYSSSMDLQNKNIIEINFINNKINSNSINSDMYEYKMKQLSI
jgi:hypothetical protein